MQNSIVIRPWFHGRLADDYFLKKILCIFQRSEFCLHFGRVVHVQGRLNIIFLRSSVDDKVNLALFSGLLLFDCLRNLHHADIYRAIPAQQFVIYDVFHDVRFLLLPEVRSGVAKADVSAVILRRIFKVFLPLDIIAFGIAEQEEFHQVVQIVRNCRA